MICKRCLVEGGIAGQGFTKWACNHCDKEFMHHNTAVPKYCPECAERLGRCEQCGTLLPDVNRVHCSDCEYYEFEEDIDNVHQWCHKDHEDVDGIWNQDGFVCPDFKQRT